MCRLCVSKPAGRKPQICPRRTNIQRLNRPDLGLLFGPLVGIVSLGLHRYDRVIIKGAGYYSGLCSYVGRHEGFVRLKRHCAFCIWEPSLAGEAAPQAATHTHNRLALFSFIRNINDHLHD